MPVPNPSPDNLRTQPPADALAPQAPAATSEGGVPLDAILPPPVVEGQIPPERFAKLKTVAGAVIGFVRWAEQTLPPIAAGLHKAGVFDHLEARASRAGPKTGKVMKAAAGVGRTLTDYHQLKNE